MKQCDITKVGPLLALLETAPTERNAQWLTQFYVSIVDASFRCETPQIFTGPDGFPYFSLLSPDPGKEFDSFCLCNLVGPATEDGFGIAINRRGNNVDWIFSYGDLLAFRLTGNFRDASDVHAEPPKKIMLEKAETVLTGAPSETYLPSYARSAIKGFMRRSLGIDEPQVFLMHRAADPRPMQLVFSVFREQFETEEQYFLVLNHLSWFLPRHYSITGIPMSSDLRNNFVPL